MKTFSTVQVARTIGVHKQTLLAWLYEGKVSEPKRTEIAGQDVRLWSASDLRAVGKYKAANYRKGRGRKKAAQK